MKHVFTLVVAGTYLIPLLNLRLGTLELLADTLVTYFLARGMKNRKNMPWIVFWCVNADNPPKRDAECCFRVNMAHLTYKYAAACQPVQASLLIYGVSAM